MKLIEDWRLVLRYAWSVRLIVLSALLTGLDVGMQVLANWSPSPWLAAASGIVACAAAVARFIPQRKVSGDGSAAQE